MLAKYFSNELRYSPATHFIRYSDHYWQESEPGAQAVAHELTRRQMKEANSDLMEALDKMKNCGAQNILDSTSKSKAEQLMNEEPVSYTHLMDDCANGYASYILEQVEATKETCADPVVLIEQRVDFSRWVEQGLGTED